MSGEDLSVAISSKSRLILQAPGFTITDHNDQNINAFDSSLNTITARSSQFRQSSHDAVMWPDASAVYKWFVSQVHVYKPDVFHITPGIHDAECTMFNVSAANRTDLTLMLDSLRGNYHARMIVDPGRDLWKQSSDQEVTVLVSLITSPSSEKQLTRNDAVVLELACLYYGCSVWTSSLVAGEAFHVRISVMTPVPFQGRTYVSLREYLAAGNWLTAGNYERLERVVTEMWLRGVMHTNLTVDTVWMSQDGYPLIRGLDNCVKLHSRHKGEVQDMIRECKAKQREYYLPKQVLMHVLRVMVRKQREYCHLDILFLKAIKLAYNIRVRAIVSFRSVPGITN